MRKIDKMNGRNIDIEDNAMKHLNEALASLKHYEFVMVSNHVNLMMEARLKPLIDEFMKRLIDSGIKTNMRHMFWATWGYGNLFKKYINHSDGDKFFSDEIMNENSEKLSDADAKKVDDVFQKMFKEFGPKKPMHHTFHGYHDDNKRL